MTRSKPSVIGLVLYRHQAWSRLILPGITRYARKYANWELKLMGPDSADQQLDTLDGLIAPIFGDPKYALIQRVRALKLPCVNISEAKPPEDITLVTHDNVRVGQLAASHLISLGLSQFGTLELQGLQVSEKRILGFTETVTEAGFPEPTPLDVKENHPETRPLQGMPTPIGIFAVNDLRARHLEQYVRKNPKLEIPRDIALIGCDNDFMECELCAVPISSIDLNMEEVGYQAARELHLQLQGDAAVRRQYIPPLGVVQRRSSDYLLNDDTMVRRILEDLRSQYADRISAASLARRQGLTQRHVQRRFKAATGKTLQQMLLEIRLEKARELLRDTPMNISEIAMETGFTDINRFPGYFRSRYGCTPRAYRNQLDNKST